MEGCAGNLETWVKQKVEFLKKELKGRPFFWSGEDPRHLAFARVLGAKTAASLAGQFKKKLFDTLVHLCKKGSVNLPYEQDRRSPIKYIYDTIDGWFLQELVRSWLQVAFSKKFKLVKVEAIGKDADFVFHFKKYTGKEISSFPDLRISYSSNDVLHYETYVEVQWSAGGRRSSYHIKENKVFTLCRQAQGVNKKGVFLWFFPHKGEGCLFALPCEEVRDKARRIPHHPPFGGKPVYEINEQFIKSGQFGYFLLEREPHSRLKELLGPR